MYTKTVAAAVMAISLTAGGFAYAQDRGNDRGPNDNYRRSNEARTQDRGPDRGRGHADHYSGDQEWRRGGHLPPEYRNRQYVVNDWRGHHLSAPPRGYHWVQHGNDYVLAAVATGIIAQLLVNHQ